MKPFHLAFLIIASAHLLTCYQIYQNDESIPTALDDLIDDLNAAEIRRDKKAHPTNDDEQSPITSHSRKNYFDSRQSDSVCQPSKMSIETDTMLDSRASVKNGARYLTVEKVGQVGQSGKVSLSELHQSCARACCDSEDECDTALLSLEAGEDGYRCYLFKCNEHCLYVKHKSYVVLERKSPEQLANVFDDSKSITTGQNLNKNLCNLKFEFKCRSGKPECVPVYDVCDGIQHCSDNSDESNCTSSSSSSSKISSSLSTTTKLTILNDAKNKNKNKQDDIDQSLYNPQTDDEFDDYKLKLFEKENSILKHLIELEEAKESERKNKASESGRKISASKQDEPVFKTPEGYLDSFFKPDPDWLAASANNKKTKSTTTKKTSSSTTKKPKYFFHDNVITEDDMYGSNTGDRLYFRDDQNRLPMSGTTMAIVLLVLGCALVISFFTYVILSTRFIRKKIKWIGTNLPGEKNVDVDGDYLINGMYL